MRIVLPLAALAFLSSACGSVASAPPELAATALTFTPAPGKSRIYVYRPSRFVGSAARLKVAVESQFVGKTGSGTFMMIELDPGSHRISGLSSESDRGVAFEALADSTYFFKLWPKMGLMSAQSGIEPMDPVEGRRAVQESRMVPANWPGEPVATSQ
jgi:Protein of unknown function (DUF2846)